MTRPLTAITATAALFLAAAAALVIPGHAGAVPDLSGEWTFEISGDFGPPFGEQTLTCTTGLEENGEVLDAEFDCGVADGTGSGTVTRNENGADIEAHLMLDVTLVGDVEADAVGTVAPDGNSMEGTWTSDSFDTEGTFEAYRTVAQYLNGDLNCDGSINALDALTAVRFDVGAEVFQHEGCPEIESEFASLFGDVNCDEDVNPIDALRILRHAGGIPLAAIPDCATVGATIVAAN